MFHFQEQKSRLEQKKVERVVPATPDTKWYTMYLLGLLLRIKKDGGLKKETAVFSIIF